MDSLDVRQFLDELEADLGGHFSDNRLTSIRTVLAGSEFGELLDGLVAHAHNQPSEKRLLQDRLTKLQQGFTDLRASRIERHRQIEVFVLGGGAGLAVGSIVSVAAQALVYPELFLLPIAAGIFAGWRGSMANHKLALEISILNDIVGRLEEHTKEMQRGRAADV